MSMVLTDEQSLLQQTASDYFAQHASVAIFRQLRTTPGQLPSGHIDALVDFGWTGILVPEQNGGLGFGLSGLAVIAIEAGRNLTVTPLFSSGAIAVNALLQCEPSSERDALLAAIAAGERTLSLAWNEQNLFDGLALNSKLESKGQQYLLSGFKPQVKDSAHAQTLLVVAMHGSEPGMAIVDLQTDGIRRDQITLLDRLDYQDINFDEVTVSAVLKWRTGADQALTNMLDCGSLLAACELFGICDEVFERTRQYLIERKQFDRPIGSFQALQHRMAKLYAELQLLKSVLYDAISAMDVERDDRSMAVSHAKALANQTSRSICSEAIQLHGGMGITDEVDIGLFFKRARVLQNEYGNQHMHRTRFASLNGY